MLAMLGVRSLPTRPVKANRPPRRSAHCVRVVSFSPEQLSKGLARQLADSASPRKEAVPSHRDWTHGLPHDPRHRTPGARLRQGWAFPAPSADFTADQLRSGLDRQLRHGAAIRAGNQEDAPVGRIAAMVADAELKKRKKEARKWITPWLDQKAHQRSIQVQAQLRQRVVLMSVDDEQRAITRLLADSHSNMERSGQAAAQVAPVAPVPTVDSTPTHAATVAVVKREEFDALSFAQILLQPVPA